MFVIEFKEGYLPIESDEHPIGSKQYSYYENHYVYSIETDEIDKYSPTKKDKCIVELAGKKKTLSLIPTGQIAISVYNKKVDELGNVRISPGTIRLASNNGNDSKFLYNPFREKKDDYTLDNIDFAYAPFLKAWFTSIEGTNVTIYDVESLEDLYRRDLQKMMENNIKAKLCARCGHMFKATTNRKYCKNCESIPKEEKRKEQNKTDPTAACIKRIDLHRIRKGRKGFDAKATHNFNSWQGLSMFPFARSLASKAKNDDERSAAFISLFRMGLLCDLYNDLARIIYSNCKDDKAALEEWNKISECLAFGKHDYNLTLDPVTKKKVSLKMYPYYVNDFDSSLSSLEQALKWWANYLEFAQDEKRYNEYMSQKENEWKQHFENMEIQIPDFTLYS